MFDQIRDRLGITAETDYSVDRAETVSAFESLLDMEGVSVDDAPAAVDEFEEIVTRYDEISADVTDAMNELTEDGGVPLLYIVDDDTELDRWQRENPDLVAEIKSVAEHMDDLLERLEVDDQSVDEGESPYAEVNGFYRNVREAEQLTR